MFRFILRNKFWNKNKSDALEFVLDFYKTQKVCYKVVDTSVIDSVPQWYMTQEACEKVVS